MSYRRTNDGGGQEVESFTAGASGAGDLVPCVAGYFIRTGESTYHTLECCLVAGHDGVHFDGLARLLWAQPAVSYMPED